MTFERFTEVSDAVLNDLYSLITVGVVGTVYTGSYLFPEQAAELFGSEQTQADGGYSFPWKPFEYMQHLVDIVPRMNAVGLGALWKESLGN